MDMLSPFLDDESIATIEKIAGKIEEKEKDPTIFQSFIQPPITKDIEGVIYLIAWLIFHCELGDRFAQGAAL